MPFIIFYLISYNIVKKKDLVARETKRLNDKNVVQLIISNKSSPTILLSLDGDIIYYNDSFSHLFDTNDIDNYVEDNIFVNKFITGGHSHRIIETTYKERYFYVEMMRCNKDIFKGIIISYIDISLIKNVYIKQEEFIKDLKHELRTPISGIIGLSDLLMRVDFDNQDELKKIYYTINDESLRINSIIDNLTANFETNTKKELIDIDYLFDDLNNVYKTRDTNIKIYFRNYVNDNLISDYKLVKQVIINLINNGLQYTSEGYVSIKAYEDINHIYISVRDTGIGMDSKELDLIFDRFYRIDKSRDKHTGGHGLGLNIVKSILVKLNATIDVKSKVNEGSTFTIKFNKNENS
jgi:two-component system phosphate regulon sensor histidine kinase PhoR